MQYECGKCSCCYFCRDSNSNSNRSDEEGQDCFGDDSLHVDRLPMELGKMAV